MRNNIIGALFLLVVALVSCQENRKTQKISEEKTLDKNQMMKEKAEKERASFDKLPNHNDSVVGCWMIDKKRSIKLSDGTDTDALFFLEEKKKLIVFDSAKDYRSEEHVGYFRFLNNELTFEITDGDKPFQDIWKVSFNGSNLVAQNKKYPKAFLYLSKVDKEDLYKR